MQKGELFYSFYTSGVLYMLFLFSLLESCLFFYVIGDCFRMSLVNVDIIYMQLSNLTPFQSKTVQKVGG